MFVGGEIHVGHGSHDTFFEIGFPKFTQGIFHDGVGVEIYHPGDFLRQYLVEHQSQIHGAWNIHSGPVDFGKIVHACKVSSVYSYAAVEPAAESVNAVQRLGRESVGNDMHGDVVVSIVDEN